jgi:hypothetical protein
MIALPEHCRIVGLPLSFRVKTESKAFSHGAVSVGDNKAAERQIQLNAYINAADKLTYWQKHDEFMALFYNLAGYRLFIDDDRYVNVAALDKVQHEFFQGFPLLKGKLSFSLKCADPLIYCKTAASASATITSSPTTTNVYNHGGVEVFPTIVLTAAANCSDIVLENATDAGRKFGYKDATLVSGQALAVNGELGTVYRGTANALNAYTGAFIRLLPGLNALKYTGGNCGLVLTWRNRWL